MQQALNGRSLPASSSFVPSLASRAAARLHSLSRLHRSAAAPTAGDLSAAARAEPLDTAVERVLITEEAILHRVKELGSILALEYAGKPCICIGVMKGAFIFAADLVRNMRPWPSDMRLEFIKASSYGNSATSSGTVAVQAQDSLLAMVKGRHVLVVEDIVDTGLTLERLRGVFREAGALSVAVVAMLDKHERRVSGTTPPEWCGFKYDYDPSATPEFLVGYGLDWNEQYRSLPYIGVLKPEVYRKPGSG